MKDLGCLIAIDDFGAGYTSFRNLRKLGVDVIKIDGAFVQNITRSEDDRAFVRTMLDLARPLGLTDRRRMGAERGRRPRCCRSGVATFCRARSSASPRSSGRGRQRGPAETRASAA